MLAGLADGNAATGRGHLARRGSITMASQSGTARNRVGDAAVRAATGKDWGEWLAVLDASGAADWSHQAIVAYLNREQGVDGWWAQMVTVGYEQARGKRQKHQKPEGFEVSGSKTIGVPLERLYAAWTDEALRGRWLPALEPRITTATPDKSLRAAIGPRERLAVNFYPKGPDRAQVNVAHQRLPDAEAAKQAKTFWRDRLQALKTLLEA
jgi:hypothetical protein